MGATLSNKRPPRDDDLDGIGSNEFDLFYTKESSQSSSGDLIERDLLLDASILSQGEFSAPGDREFSAPEFRSFSNCSAMFEGSVALTSYTGRVFTSASATPTAATFAKLTAMAAKDRRYTLTVYVHCAYYKPTYKHCFNTAPYHPML